jgi:hypothetical protein
MSCFLDPGISEFVEYTTDSLSLEEPIERLSPYSPDEVVILSALKAVFG